MIYYLRKHKEIACLKGLIVFSIVDFCGIRDEFLKNSCLSLPETFNLRREY